MRKLILAGLIILTLSSTAAAMRADFRFDLAGGHYGLDVAIALTDVTDPWDVGIRLASDAWPGRPLPSPYVSGERITAMSGEVAGAYRWRGLRLEAGARAATKDARADLPSGSTSLWSEAFAEPVLRIGAGGWPGGGRIAPVGWLGYGLRSGPDAFVGLAGTMNATRWFAGYRYHDWYKGFSFGMRIGS